MSVPTEAEIREAAQLLGHADESGNYPRGIRNKLAATVQLVKQEAAEAADPSNDTTAEQLAHFADDLGAAGINRISGVDLLLVEAARHLLETQGLRLAPKEGVTTP
jgi:hypothetical protein